jgi:hypothetical protein
MTADPRGGGERVRARLATGPCWFCGQETDQDQWPPGWRREPGEYAPPRWDCQDERRHHVVGEVMRLRTEASQRTHGHIILGLAAPAEPDYCGCRSCAWFGIPVTLAGPIPPERDDDHEARQLARTLTAGAYLLGAWEDIEDG